MGFYIIQGFYKGLYGSISREDSKEDQAEAVTEAKRLKADPTFEGDRVRVITADGDLVWHSNNPDVIL